jgi:hypothetical protein
MSINDSQARGGWFMIAAGVTIEKVYAYCTGAAASTECQAAIYSATPGSTSITRVAISDSVSVASAGLKTFTFSSPPTLSQGTIYYVFIRRSSGTNLPNFYGRNVTTGSIAPYPSAQFNASGGYGDPETITSNASLIWLALGT